MVQTSSPPAPKPRRRLLASEYDSIAKGADFAALGLHPQARSGAYRDGFTRAPLWAACARSGVAACEVFLARGGRFDPQSTGAPVLAFMFSLSLEHAQWILSLIEAGRIDAAEACPDPAKAWGAFESHCDRMDALHARPLLPSESIAHALGLHRRIRALYGDPPASFCTQLSVARNYVALCACLAEITPDVETAQTILDARSFMRPDITSQAIYRLDFQSSLAKTAGRLLLPAHPSSDVFADVKHCDPLAAAFAMGAGARVDEPLQPPLAALAQGILNSFKGDGSIAMLMAPLIRHSGQASRNMHPEAFFAQMLIDAGSLATSAAPGMKSAFELAQDIRAILGKNNEPELGFSLRSIYALLSSRNPGLDMSDPFEAFCLCIERQAEREHIALAATGASPSSPPRPRRGL